MTWLDCHGEQDKMVWSNLEKTKLLSWKVSSAEKTSLKPTRKFLTKKVNLRKKEKKKMAPKNGNDKGVIVLHQFPRTKNAPSPSPYPMKVETFLRMNKLPYVAGILRLG
jgi:hypothetical protein